jgi:hypothetical protein
MNRPRAVTVADRNEFAVWREMEGPSRHIHGLAFPLSSSRQIPEAKDRVIAHAGVQRLGRVRRHGADLFVHVCVCVCVHVYELAWHSATRRRLPKGMYAYLPMNVYVLELM